MSCLNAIEMRALLSHECGFQYVRTEPYMFPPHWLYLTALLFRRLQRWKNWILFWYVDIRNDAGCVSYLRVYGGSDGTYLWMVCRRTGLARKTSILFKRETFNCRASFCEIFILYFVNDSRSPTNEALLADKVEREARFENAEVEEFSTAKPKYTAFNAFFVQAAGNIMPGVQRYV